MGEDGEGPEDNELQIYPVSLFFQTHSADCYNRLREMNVQPDLLFRLPSHRRGGRNATGQKSLNVTVTSVSSSFQTHSADCYNRLREMGVQIFSSDCPPMGEEVERPEDNELKISFFFFFRPT